MVWTRAPIITETGPKEIVVGASDVIGALGHNLTAPEELKIGAMVADASAAIQDAGSCPRPAGDDLCLSDERKWCVTIREFS